MSAAAAAAAGSSRQSRSASAVFAKAAKGFHVFRIDGYSLTAKALPGGECVSSKDFAVGGHRWRVDLYPNGADASKDNAASISLFLRTRPGSSSRRRVRAQYKFSLLDAAGRAAYELPAATGVFASCSGDRDVEAWCGYAEFISKAALQRRRGSLLRDDRLVVRCDVTVTQLKTVHIGTKHYSCNNGAYTDSDGRDESSDQSDANSYNDSSGNSKANSYNDSSGNSEANNHYDSSSDNNNSFNSGDSGASDSSGSSDSSSSSADDSDNNNSNGDSSSDDSDSSDSPDSSSSDGLDSDSSDGSDSDGEMPAHRNKRRRLDDTEYVQQCLAERLS